MEGFYGIERIFLVGRKIRQLMRYPCLITKSITKADGLGAGKAAKFGIYAREDQKGKDYCILFYTIKKEKENLECVWVSFEIIASYPGVG